MEDKELQIDISGIVQGVNLRGRINKLANALNLRGYVENNPDGSVTIIAQGNESSLDELLSYCQKPPFMVKITGMSYVWKEAVKKYNKFKIEKDQPLLIDQARSFMNLGKQMLKHNKLNVPNHVVIIPDGNRRWAREKGWRPWVGHRKAAEYERIVQLFDECKTLGVKYLSFWAFSTENWKRDEREVDQIFNVLRNLHDKMKNEFDENQIKFRHFGRKDRLPEDIIAILDDLEERTEDYDSLHFQLCLDYNGRDDLVRAYQDMLNDEVEKVDESVISDYLDSKGIPDPDLVIRTSGEKRTSGIMAYQAAYAELYFTNVYFPDFDAEHFRLAIFEYAARNRSFGGTKYKDHAKVDENDLTDPDESEGNIEGNLAV